ncbi:MAG: hypothetical protein HOP11_04705 [Saprospiraceae bacterium]|nr:hypothetical protein [Saprospiraceae bacterium]
MKINYILAIKCAVFFLFNGFLNILIAQPSDAQWYVWKGLYGDNSVLNHNTQLQPSDFIITNLQHPGSDIQITGQPNLDTRDDLFIIFSNGSFYNSRYLLTRPDPCNNYNGCSHHASNQGLRIVVPSSQISFLYHSNIYEDDDPAGSIYISQGTTGSTPQYSVTGTNQNSTTLSANHSVVKGKDYTLIVPRSLFTENHPNLICKKIGINLPSDLFIFDTLLNPYSTATISIINSNLLVLNNAAQFNFINFHVPSNSTYPLNTCEIKVGCYDSINSNLIPNSIKIINESIDTAHDPNFIMVTCVEEVKSKWWYFSRLGKKTYIKYHIEFENDGLAAATNCQLEFTLPTTIKSNTLSIRYWYYGGVQGCNLNESNPGKINLEMTTSNGLMYVFNFNQNSSSPKKLEGIIKPPLQRKAFIDFCVELKNNENFQSCNLKPTNCFTYFGNTQYTIDRFIDRDTSNINWRNIKIKRISKNNCSINCISQLQIPREK